MLKEALKKRDFTEDALILAKTASIIRKEIFNHDAFKFDGSFPENCQEASLPSSLKTLISLIFNGVSLKKQEKHESQACLTVDQAIVYNTKKKSKESSTQTRHSLEREPPLPVYIGLKIHGLTRCKQIIQQLHELGISVSYDRVIKLEEWIAEATCERFEEDEIFPTENQPGESRSPVTIPPAAPRKHILPEAYTTVPAVAITNSNVLVPKCDMKPAKKCLDQAKEEEIKWVENSSQLLKKADLNKEDAIAWAAYHASQELPLHAYEALCALLPLFYEKSATPAMIKHGMNVLRQAFQFLNPGQILVATFDQPLFALAKLIQWQFPATHGESKHVVMLGGLHTEMALWNTLGDMLQGSGWTAALTKAELASAGTSESMLNVTHLARNRYAHQVTFLTLQILQREAFLLSKTQEYEESESVWRTKMKTKSPTFIFCDLILRDMKSLPQPIKEEFEGHGNWVVSKTGKAFSAIPFDHAHEQENRSVKGSGGCIGLTENPVAFRRWMLSGPELSRLQKQFEKDLFPDEYPDNPQIFQNHEQGLSTQTTFQKQVVSLCDTIRKMGNPFLADFSDLITLDSPDCADESVVDAH
ncbi:hypothetical protein ACROYT_G005106 [Oculina patagonica]